MEDKKTEATLRKEAKEAGRIAAASLPIWASSVTRLAVYEDARNKAYLQGSQETCNDEPLKAEGSMTRKRKSGQ